MPKNAKPETVEITDAPSVEAPQGTVTEKSPRKGMPRGRLTTGRTVCSIARRLTEAQLAAIRQRLDGDESERACWTRLALAAVETLCVTLERDGAKLLAAERTELLTAEEAELQARLQALRDERTKLARGAA